MFHRENTPTPEEERTLAVIDDALAGRATDPADAELAELALLIAADRSDPEPAFAAELDERASAGFPRRGADGAPRRGWVAPWRTWMLPAMGAAATIAVVAVVAVGQLDEPDDPVQTFRAPELTSEGADADSGAGAGAGAEEAAAPEGPAARERRAAQEPALADDQAVAPGAASPLPPVGGSRLAPNVENRRQELAASITLAAPSAEIRDVADGVVRVTDQLKGIVMSSSVTVEEGTGTASFDLRIRADRLDRALAEYSKLAHVRARTQAATDITGQTISARERLTDARAERRALLRRLARATTAVETESIRAQLRSVRARIDRHEADVAQLARRANYATVALTIEADDEASRGDDESGWGLGDAVEDAVDVLRTIAGIGLVSLAVLLPVGLLAAVLMLVGRGAVRRRREAALDER